MTLNFHQLRETNAKRCAHWHPGFPHDEAWTLSDWSNAMAGEMGEAANVVKKIRRVETGNPGKHDGATADLVAKLGQELADVILYADLLAAKAGLDLGEEIRRKFDAVSEREGFPERLSADAGAERAERAALLNRAYRIPPNDDTDGHSGETWREFAADTDMARIEAERERDEWRGLARELMDDPNERGCPPVSDGWIHRPYEPYGPTTYCERCGEAWPCPNERARAALEGSEGASHA